ncbi:MAG: hypothetical protein ACOYN4_09830 [Bacteroidales bacterium]
MKFTLKLQLDSAQELATFIQDMNMEIDMPFIESSMANEQFQQTLSQTIVNYELKIQSLEKQLEYLANTTTAKLEKYLDENYPPKTNHSECPAIQQIQSHFTEAEIQPEPGLIQPNNEDVAKVIEPIAENAGTTEKPSRNYVCNPKPCEECGKEFTAHHNKVKWCNDCRSKKVKYPTHKPD